MGKSSTVKQEDVLVQQVDRLMILKQKVWALRDTYKEIDRITLSLVGKKLPDEIVFKGTRYSVELNDNFATSNTAFRAAAVSRWEMLFKAVRKKK